MDNEKKPVVFIVDDSMTLRKMLQRVLSELDFETHEAACGEDAIELFKKATPDAILMDVEMPGIGGFVACEQIRTLPKGKLVPIMMVTSLEDLESINRAYKAGATDFATKPLNWDIIGHRVKYMVRTGHDFLELQKTKQELNQLNMELEERVIERTGQLKAANKELTSILEELKSTQEQLVESEKLASLGSLVAGIAHEINTPIGVVITGTSVLKEKTQVISGLLDQNRIRKTDLNDYLTEVHEITEVSTNNLHQASKLVQNFKQIAADRINENSRNFNLKEYLESVIFNMKVLLQKHQIQASVDCDEQIEVNSFPGVLSQIVGIFIMNSIEHAWEPGAEHCSIGIEAHVTDHQIEVNYTDNGKGIMPENLKRIFEPFFTTRRSKGNVGLGLNLAYNSATKILGGTLKCVNLDIGTRFTLTFPIGIEGGQ